jgi:hypothetical protein
MIKPFTGGCACGKIRFEIPSEPIAMVDCQCRDCQRTSGTGHGSYLVFTDRNKVKVSGDASLWPMTGDSGNVKSRRFCPTCGAPVFLTFAAVPDLFTVHAASLDEPGRYSPQMVTYTMRALPWDQVDPALPKFETMPPM